jgi:hypothetical protein
LTFLFLPRIWASNKRILRREPAAVFAPRIIILFLSFKAAVSSEISWPGFLRFVEKRAWHPNLFVGHDDGEIRAEKGAHAALLALLHFLAFWREITLGVHFLGLFKNLGRAEFDADPATLAVPLLYVQCGHSWLISSFFG